MIMEYVFQNGTFPQGTVHRECRQYHADPDNAMVDGFFDSGAGDNLAILFEVIIAEAEFLHGTVVESVLIVTYKLFPVIILQGNE